ncbi:hypothetical protein QTP88_002485 [Uroleucon formosanum]
MFGTRTQQQLLPLSRHILPAAHKAQCDDDGDDDNNNKQKKTIVRLIYFMTVDYAYVTSLRSTANSGTPMAKDDTPAAVGNIKRAPVPGTLYMGTYYLFLCAPITTVKRQKLNGHMCASVHRVPAGRRGGVVMNAEANIRRVGAKNHLASGDSALEIREPPAGVAGAAAAAVAVQLYRFISFTFPGPIKPKPRPSS